MSRKPLSKVKHPQQRPSRDTRWIFHDALGREYTYDPDEGVTRLSTTEKGETPNTSPATAFTTSEPSPEPTAKKPRSRLRVPSKKATGPPKRDS